MIAEVANANVVLTCECHQIVLKTGPMRTIPKVILERNKSTSFFDRHNISFTIMAQQTNYLLLLLLVHHNLQSVSRSPTNSASTFASVTGMPIFGTVAVQGCTGITPGAKLNIVSTRELHLIATSPRPVGAISKISLDNKKSGRINAKICYLGSIASHVHSIFVA